MGSKPMIWLAATLFAALTVQAAVTAQKQPAPASFVKNTDYGKIPLAFEPNVGQAGAGVRFLARSGGMTVLFTNAGTDLVLSRNGEQAVVRMKLEGSARPRQIAGLDRQPGVSNYFMGNDASQWRTDVPHYARVRYEGVYPGIDMLWYGNQRRLEYDFVVGPGADPGRIQVAYEGVESLNVDANGDLLLRTALGEMRQQKPRVYQEIGGRQVEVGAQYSILARQRVSFELARYDRRRELRIDPVVLAYSTFLGGSAGNSGKAIAVDSSGSAYIAGSTSSKDFPTASAYQTSLLSSPPSGYTPSNAFVTKLTPAGDALVYSTYLGGIGYDYAYGIAVDATGAAYITGTTSSTNFPTKSPLEPNFLGGGEYGYNAFVTKLAPAGNALVYSTYLGGPGDDYAAAIAVDATGSAYITGDTTSRDMTVVSAFQISNKAGSTSPNAFVTKLTPAGNALAYSTYLGGSVGDYGNAIAVDREGSAYVTGYTYSSDFPTTPSAFQPLSTTSHSVFVTKLAPSGSALAYSTFLDGTGGETGNAIAVDSAGSAYVTGSTSSKDFPTQSPYQATFQAGTEGSSGFVSKLTPAGNALVYSTYLEGSNAGGFVVENIANAIAVDAAGDAYVAGYTNARDFPTLSPYQASFQDSSYGTFVTKLAPAGNALIYSTYLSGKSNDEASAIAVDGTGSVYVTGNTTSTNFPTLSPYQGTLPSGGQDAFVTKFSPFGTGAPFGSFDTPTAASSNVDGSVGFTGWALSEAGIASVGIYRDPNPGEATQSNGLVYIGTASSITGSRTDIAALYPTYPESNSAGWGFLILTNELPSNSGNTGVGNGTYNIHAIALDLGGNSKDLGVKTIVVDNKASVTPFGGIDTPAQGATVSGTAYVNFGWALTPQPNMIATNGSTINVLIDAKPVGHPVYNNPRADIEALFPGYANTDGAVGYFKINTTTLTNGLHQISWSVTDSAGHKTGIGSRFFIVQN